VYELRSDAADPLALDASFGVDAGGQRARVSLDGRADPIATLAPSDPPKSAGRRAPADRQHLAVTAQSNRGWSAGRRRPADRDRGVKLENLSDQPLTAAAPRRPDRHEPRLSSP